MAINFKEQEQIFKLEVDEHSKSSFLEMARWTKFLAMFTFVMMGLALAGGLIGGFILSRFSDAAGSSAPMAALGAAGPAVLVFLILVIAGIYFYPAFALYKYSTHIKTALSTDSKQEFNIAVKYLKNSFKYIGILFIVFIIVYGLQLLFMLLAVS